jgi:transaldolase
MSTTASALHRLAALHPATEIWWDSSPLIYPYWREDTRYAWRERPEMWRTLEALGVLGQPEAVFRGSTTNPPLAWGAIEADRLAWDGWARKQARNATSPQELFWGLYEEVCRRAAAVLAPLHAASRGRQGYVCAQVDPRQQTDLAAMLTGARRLHALAPNIMIKMPATQEGIEGIRILASEGICTTATLCFSVSQMVAVAEAAQAGAKAARAAGRDLSGWRCCAALMMGRMEAAPEFAQQAEGLGIALTEADLRWAGVAVARKACAIFHQRGYATKVLCASMRLGPEVDGEQRIWHLEQLAGGDMVLTIFPNILASFLELYADRPLEPRIEDPVPDEALERLLRIPYFRQAYEENAVARPQFADLPGVRITSASFAESMQTIEDYGRTFWDARHP